MKNNLQIERKKKENYGNFTLDILVFALKKK